MYAGYLSKTPAIDIPDENDFEKCFNQYTAQLATVGCRTTDEICSKLITRTEENIKLLETVCSIENILPPLSDEITLPYDGFKPNFVEYSVPERALKLKTLQSVQSRNRSDNKKLNKSTLKYRGEINLEGECKAENQLVDLKPCSFYVLSVRVYLPGLRPKSSTTSRSKSPQVSQELLCLSSGTLDHLRDRILCSMDYQPLTGDVSEDPFVPTTVRAKDVDKSAIFYFGNNFYVDTRDPENVDYSTKIIQWGQSKGFNFGKVFKMENATFYDVKDLRLGYPYVYIHQRFCEHLIVITDARLLHEKDHMDSTKYPIMTSFANLPGKYCFTCRKRPSKYLMVGNKRLPFEVTHFCTICLNSFNYANGIKVGHFQVYKYVDRASLI